MCILSFQWQPDARIPLILAANRDEFYARPTQALHVWEDPHMPPLLAGRDLKDGGTWLGAHRYNGRVAALTNYRAPHLQRNDAPSRGRIVTSFLNSTQSAEHFARDLAKQSNAYNPFNLLMFDGRDLVGYESRHQRYFPIEPGVGSVSNADFDTPWPKVQRLRAGFKAAVHRHPPQHELPPALEAEIWAHLAHADAAPDNVLPRTGIPLERERALSSTFIRTPDYGTRASTLLVHGRSHLTIVERSFTAQGACGEARITLNNLQEAS